MNSISKYWKAIVGFITPGVVALVAAVQDGSPAGQAITTTEWVTIAAACIVTGGVVFTVPNKTSTAPKGTEESPDADAVIVEEAPVEVLEDNTDPTKAEVR